MRPFKYFHIQGKANSLQRLYEGHDEDIFRAFFLSP